MLDGLAAVPALAEEPPRLVTLDPPAALEPKEALAASESPPPDDVSGLPLASEASIVTKPVCVASVPPMTRAAWTMWFAVRLALAST